MIKLVFLINVSSDIEENFYVVNFFRAIYFQKNPLNHATSYASYHFVNLPIYKLTR